MQLITANPKVYFYNNGSYLNDNRSNYSPEGWLLQIPKKIPAMVTKYQEVMTSETRDQISMKLIGCLH